MNKILRNTLATAILAIATQAAAQITFYENEGFAGRTFATQQRVENFADRGFNDRALSAVVVGNRWEVCEDSRFRGRCVILRPGRYPSLAAMGLNNRISSVRAVDRNARIDDSRYAPLPPAPAPEVPHITFYENDGFQGRVFTTNNQVDNLARYGFNDRASSAVVLGDRWEVCEDVRFGGHCVVLRPGSYPSLAEMTLNDRISSARTVSRNARIDDNRYAPAPIPAYDNRWRKNEQLYEANVTSVRAVLGTSGQRCWVEREAVPQGRGSASIPGGIVGAIIGGILGHQIGSGTGQDIATAGGVVAGAVVGANVGRSGSGQQTQDVQRCENVTAEARTDYWDVIYNFRGQEHRVQMTTPPGPTITVNAQGEPRT